MRKPRHKLLAAMLLATLPIPSVFAQAISDPSTIQGKVLAGYQGWFRCAGDGSPYNNWSHWTIGNAPPTLTNISVDAYPDLTGMDPSSLCNAAPFTIGGKAAYLFTSFALQTEETHFAWMREYGIDGVLAQRFLSDVSGNIAEKETVLRNIMTAAQDNGRVFAVEYDLTSSRNNRTDDEFMAALEADWLHLVNDLGITRSPSYLQQGGRPLVSVWGIGMDNHNYVDNSDLGQRIITWFHDVAHVSVMAGVSSGWTTPGQNGSAAGNGWPAVYAQYDVIQPWPVGKYNDNGGADWWMQNEQIPDMAVAKKNNQLYMPVIFPGSGDHNGDPSSPENPTPRQGGTFLWHQAYNAKTIGAPAIKIAMFDEVNESTSIFKVAATRKDAPDQGYWLTLDADGYQLPSDWYLRLAYEIKQAYLGSVPMPEVMPATPWIGTAKNCGVLTTGQTLEANDEVVSCDGRTELVMQGDGNLVLYVRHSPVWASNTGGTDAREAVMQANGDLLVRSSGGTVRWDSGTSGHDGAFVRVQDDGAASIVDTTGIITSTR
jgi:hypothetical protein